MKTEALPCPFCGLAIDLDDDDTLYPSGIYWRDENGMRHYVAHKGRREGDGVVYWINCKERAGGCGAEIYGDSMEEVIAKWNRRQPAAV